MPDQDLAAKIVDTVLMELEGRRGIGGELRAIEADKEVWDELRGACCERVKGLLAQQDSEETPASKPPRTQGWIEFDDGSHAGVVAVLELRHGVLVHTGGATAYIPGLTKRDFSCLGPERNSRR